MARVRDEKSGGWTPPWPTKKRPYGGRLVQCAGGADGADTFQKGSMHHLALPLSALR